MRLPKLLSILCLPPLALAAVTLVALTVAPAGAGDIVTVFCSIAPQAFVLERVGGDAVEVHVLVGPGQSPHTFEPTPRQMAELTEARVYFTLGLPFERELAERIADLNPDLVVVDMSAGIERRQIEGGHDHDDHGPDCDHSQDAGLPDPHVWLDPRNAGLMARAVHYALADLSPERTGALGANVEALLNDLDDLHAELAEALSPLGGGRVYVFHPAFGYFTDAYGLVQVPIELGGTEPSARELAELIERARTDEVRIVFVQPQFSSKSAAAIAAEIGGAVVHIDPLAADYIANLRHIAQEVRKALAE